MAAHSFNVIVKQIVEREINKIVEADTEAQALELAKMALRDGEGVAETVLQEVVDQNMMLDAEEIDMDLMRFADSHARLNNA